MNEIEKKTNKILDNLPYFMKNEEDSNNYKFIKSFSQEFFVLDSAVNELKRRIQVGTSQGTYLDDLGLLFGLRRGLNEPDSDFKVRIESFWEGYIKGGTKESLIETFKTLTGVEDVTYSEDEMIIRMSSVVPSLSVDLNLVRQALNDIKPAGTYIFIALISILEDLYSNYSDFSSISTSTSGYVTPDITQVGSAVFLL